MVQTRNSLGVLGISKLYRLMTTDKSQGRQHGEREHRDKLARTSPKEHHQLLSGEEEEGP
jgi:hypothetical protein